MRDLVPSPGIEPGPPAVGTWSLNCWTTREVPPLSSCLHGFWGEVTHNSYLCSSIGVFFPLASFYIFSLSLICSSLDVISIGVVGFGFCFLGGRERLAFILFGDLRVPWICGLGSDIKFVKFSGVIVSNLLLFLSVFLLFLLFPLHVVFVIVPQFLACLFWLLFFFSVFFLFAFQF